MSQRIVIKKANLNCWEINVFFSLEKKEDQEYFARKKTINTDIETIKC